MKSLHIQNAHIVDPAQALDGDGFSLWIQKGKIAAITKTGESAPFEADETIDATGLVLSPGLIDLSARLNSIEA